MRILLAGFPQHNRFDLGTGISLVRLAELIFGAFFLLAAT